MPPKYGDSNTSLTFTQPSTPPHPTYTPIRSPGSNELLIKVHAAAINPVDVQIWGSPLIGWLAGNRVKGIGRDYAGEIVAVGAGLHSKWSEGDRVFGFFMRPVRSCSEILTITFAANGDEDNHPDPTLMSA